MKPSALVDRPDLELGTLVVSPGCRLLKGPAGEARVEPLTMHLFLLLIDAAGEVVTREQLFERCWNGAPVGDASINRNVAQLRRAITASSPGAIAIETIPRTGYRLVRPQHDQTDKAPRSFVPPPTDDRAGLTSDRRALLVGGGTVLAVAGLGGALWRRQQLQAEAADLASQGAELVRQEIPQEQPRAVQVLRRSVTLRPDDADSWAQLALANRNLVEFGPPSATAAHVAACREAAARALALDPDNADARAALAKLWPIFGDWLASEQRLRSVLQLAPSNTVALSALGTLCMAVGRVRDAARLAVRYASLDPLSPIYQFRKAFSLWSLGQLSEADRIIDRALRLWPRHPTLWNARVLLFALTDRPHAALAMLADREALPPYLPGPAIAGWQAMLGALADARPEKVAAAMAGTKAQIGRNPAAAVHGICVASRIGDLDSAFAMADAYLLRRGPLVGTLRNSASQHALTDQRWQMTMMLFIPATRPMRGDPRFLPLCRDMGMVSYWQKSGTRPDFLAGSA